MKSTIAEAINLGIEPVALILTDEKPKGAVRAQVGKDVVSFTIPFQRFLEMEANIEGSFLEHEPWVSLR